MKSNIIFSILLSLIFVTVPASAQTSLTPAITLSDEVLKRPVRQWVIEKDDTLTMLLTYSFMQAKVPGGVVYSTGFDQKTRIKIHPTSLALRDVLDSIVAVAPGYRWEFGGGVVNLLPTEGCPPLLHTFLAEFHQERATVRDMVEALELSPEVHRQAAALGFGQQGSFYDGPVNTETFSVNCKNATVFEILNEIARVSRKAVWSYSEHTRSGKKYFRLSVLYS